VNKLYIIFAPKYLLPEWQCMTWLCDDVYTGCIITDDMTDCHLAPGEVTMQVLTNTQVERW